MVSMDPLGGLSKSKTHLATALSRPKDNFSLFLSTDALNILKSRSQGVLGVGYLHRNKTKAKLFKKGLYCLFIFLC